MAFFRSNGSRRPNVVVVEDFDFVHKAIRGKFPNHWRIKKVQTRDDALKSRFDKADAIVLDVNMPVRVASLWDRLVRGKHRLDGQVLDPHGFEIAERLIASGHGHKIVLFSDRGDVPAFCEKHGIAHVTKQRVMNLKLLDQDAAKLAEAVKKVVGE